MRWRVSKPTSSTARTATSIYAKCDARLRLPAYSASKTVDAIPNELRERLLEAFREEGL